MTSIPAKEQTNMITCTNEYTDLQKVVVVPPEYMEIQKAINETQRYYLKENIDRSKALRQHQQFVNVLKEAGIEVISLHPNKDLNEQVFTRDIGFTIGETLFVSNMGEAVRKPEKKTLLNWLEAFNYEYKDIFSDSIEGGDILLDGNDIWVGRSNRTTDEAIHTLKDHLPNYNICPITLNEEILHLDCVLNIVSSDTALIYKKAIDPISLKRLRKKYHLIEVSDDEQFNMGPNVLSIGGKQVISLPDNKQVNQQLREAGFTVMDVPFSEIIKSGGSFRCCTLPLIRG
ncbi:dimethylarginine dimethylaminohydrolase family protein [Oceanobacillus manasiensis]|uniref:dimethylarginine dimethylaminohydrolase family protein n=1 Tax=Oceanobacillus manasiensis TaxID=586413 RepID=UPI0005AA789C|nr:arginine deiminase family protein [Oceanobacillus manasiensis]